MNKIFFLISSVLLTFFLSTTVYAGTMWVGDEVVIKVDQVRLRESPDQNSKIIVLLKKGDLANIIRHSGDKLEKIKGIESRWYKIQVNGKEGWVFGGLLEPSKRTIVKKTEIYEAWADRYDVEEENKYFYLKMKNKKDLIKIIIDPDLSDYEISPNGKYVAFDSGTDGVGGIQIYEIESQKLVYEASYAPREIVWKNNTIEIHRVISTHHCYLLWELDVFDNGIIKKNVKNGKGDYHCE